MRSNLKNCIAAILLSLIAGGSLMAAGNQDTSDTKEAPTSAVMQRGSEFNEAPILHDMVVAGTLPALGERLPENPYVQEVYEDIGYYGGSMRRAWKGPGDKWGPAKLAEEFLVKFDRDGQTIIPNVAERYEVLNDGAEYVFYLRKGLKWSDGDDFDAEDVTFYYNHVVLKELWKGVNECFKVNGELCTVTSDDDYTVRVKFPAPSPMFLQNMIFQVREFYTPSHYAKTILPEFIGEEKALEIATTAGYADIRSYIKQKLYYYWIEDDVPMMRAWVPSNDNSDQRWIMKRNPYFFKVDKEGNQLPYIDEIVHVFVEDNSIVSMKGIAGELDMQFRHLEGDKADNFTLFVENQEQGGYKVLKMVDPVASKDTFFPNQYHKDPVLREIFRDVRFRQAMSVSINRAEILDIAYSGMGVARQASLAPGMPYYTAEWEQAYAQYDPDLANRLLDEMGLKWDSDHKYRLRPDGKVLEILLQNDRTYADPIILAAKNMNEVGIKAIVKTLDRAYLEELRDNNDLDVGVWGYEGVNFLIDHSSMIPLTRQHYFAGMGGRYIETEGESGEPLFGDLAKVVSNYQEIQKTVDPAKKERLAKEIVELSTKNIWAIGMVGLTPSIGVVNKDMKNVEQGLLSYDALRNVGILAPWQMYFDQK